MTTWVVTRRQGRSERAPIGAWSSIDTLAVAVIAAACVLLYGRGLSVGGFWNTDEARHAMDGAFILDFARAMPVGDPMAFAAEYFVRYPALGFAWYPPFFAAVEALFFAVLGVGEVGARLTVLAFAFLCAAALYVWARMQWGRLVAAMGAAFLLLNANFTFWAIACMLEVPATAMVMCAVLAFECFLSRPSAWRGLLAGAVLAATLMTKQTTGFILPVLFLYPLLTGRATALWARGAWFGYALVALAVAALAAHAFTFGQVALETLDKGFHEAAGVASPRGSLDRWLLHLRVIVDGFSAPALLLAGMGLFVAARDRRRGDMLLLLWLASWYLAFTLVSGVYDNSIRYGVYAAVPVSLLAARAVETLPWRRLAGCVAGVAIVWGGWSSLRVEPQFVRGYAEAASAALAQADRGALMFCCKHDGNFVMHVRALDPGHREIVLRADKILVSVVVATYFGTVSHVSAREDILEALERNGVTHVVVENRNLVGTKELDMLLELVKTDAFELVWQRPVETNVSHFQGLTLSIYKFHRRQAEGAREIVVPLPHVGRELRLRLDRQLKAR